MRFYQRGPTVRSSHCPPRVLTIAGFDGSGGAGIAADLKTISAHSCLGLSVVTAITSQNTKGVVDLMAIPPEVVESQIDAVVSDIGVDAIKIGMVGWPSTVRLIAQKLDQLAKIPVVFDPVMVATSGDPLAADEAIALMTEELLPRASVVTPNLFEAGRLRPRKGDSLFVVTGEGVDCLIGDGAVTWLTSPRVKTCNSHGTGCTFSAAIACNLALGHSRVEAVARAKQFVCDCLERFSHFKIGSGRGPVQPVILGAERWSY